MAFNCEVTWFDCSATNPGACRTCRSGNLQHAWPNTSDACLAITEPGRCGRSPGRRTCGFRHRTRSLCNGRSVVTSIADCGPHTHLFCGEQACCSGRCARDRLMDLTRAAFSSLHSLSIGKFPGTVSLP